MLSRPEASLRPEQTLRNSVIAVVCAALIVGLAVGITNAVLPPHPRAAATSLADPAAAQALAAEQAAATAREQQALEVARQKRQSEEQRMEAEARQRSDAKLQEALAAREQAAQTAREEKDRKDAAWTKFYKPLKKCVNANDPNLVFECSNHYLHEQQRFEQLWADGKL
jgi:hypothetical protein